MGCEFFIVTVPFGTSKDDVMRNFEMAEKYASVESDDEPDEYDEHFKEMVAYRNIENGMRTFNFYLEEYCGYKVEELADDFDYEW